MPPASRRTSSASRFRPSRASSRAPAVLNPDGRLHPRAARGCTAPGGHASRWTPGSGRLARPRRRPGDHAESSVRFSGVVESRTDGYAKSTEPPAESRIHELNPKRAEKLAEIGGWRETRSGSLNIRIADGVDSGFRDEEPAWREPAGEVAYPRGWEHIPQKRAGWRYWRGTVRTARAPHPVPVMIRQANDAHNPLLVELFAGVKLRAHFDLRDGDTVHISLTRR